MTAPGQRLEGAALAVAHAFDIDAAKARLAADGGYEIIHESAGLEIGVYVLVAPEPDHQQPTSTTRSTSSLRAERLTSKASRLICVKAMRSSFPPVPSTSSLATSS